MAKEKGNKTLLQKLLAIGVKEHVKTASEEEIGEVLKLSVAMDAGESEGADAEAHVAGCKCTDCMGSAKDAKAKDKRARYHSVLDKMLDAGEANQQEEQEALDADMEELRGLLAGGAGSEKTKDTPGVDAESEEEAEAEDSDEDEEENEEAEAEDEAVESAAAPVIPAEARAKSPAPSAVDAATVLKALKPFIATAGTPAGAKRLAKAFDTATKTVKDNTKGSKGSYKAVAHAAAATGKDAAEQLDNRTKQQKISDEANAAYRGMRGKNSVKK